MPNHRRKSKYTNIISTLRAKPRQDPAILSDGGALRVILGAALRGQTRAFATARTTSVCEITPSNSPSFSTKRRCTLA